MPLGIGIPVIGAAVDGLGGTALDARIGDEDTLISVAVLRSPPIARVPGIAVHPAYLEIEVGRHGCARCVISPEFGIGHEHLRNGVIEPVLFLRRIHVRILDVVGKSVCGNGILLLRIARKAEFHVGVHPPIVLRRLVIFMIDVIENVDAVCILRRIHGDAAAVRGRDDEGICLLFRRPVLHRTVHRLERRTFLLDRDGVFRKRFGIGRNRIARRAQAKIEGSEPDVRRLGIADAGIGEHGDRFAVKDETHRAALAVDPERDVIALLIIGGRRAAAEIARSRPCAAPRAVRTDIVTDVDGIFVDHAVGVIAVDGIDIVEQPARRIGREQRHAEFGITVVIAVRLLLHGEHGQFDFGIISRKLSRRAHINKVIARSARHFNGGVFRAVVIDEIPAVGRLRRTRAAPDGSIFEHVRLEHIVVGEGDIGVDARMIGAEALLIHDDRIARIGGVGKTERKHGILFLAVDPHRFIGHGNGHAVARDRLAVDREVRGFRREPVDDGFLAFRHIADELYAARRHTDGDRLIAVTVLIDRLCEDHFDAVARIHAVLRIDCGICHICGDADAFVGIGSEPIGGSRAVLRHKRARGNRIYLFRAFRYGLRGCRLPLRRKCNVVRRHGVHFARIIERRSVAPLRKGIAGPRERIDVAQHKRRSFHIGLGGDAACRIVSARSICDGVRLRIVLFAFDTGDRRDQRQGTGDRHEYRDERLSSRCHKISSILSFFYFSALRRKNQSK